MRLRLAFALALAIVILSSRAHGLNEDLWEPLITKLAQDGYSEALLRQHFTHPDMAYLPSAMGLKLRTLFKIRFEPSEPPKKKKGPLVYESLLTPERIGEAKKFLKANSSLFKAVNKEYGVPPDIAVSILAVETKLGQYLGEARAFATLASMANDDNLNAVRHHFGDKVLKEEHEVWLDMRASQKSEWAYEELKRLLDYTDANRLHPVTLPGSVFGAIGLCQFMPSNALRFGVDGDKDGVVDLFNLSDAVHSLANYLKGNGWKKGLSAKGQYRVIYRYNHSAVYVNTVLALAKKLRG